MKYITTLDNRDFEIEIVDAKHVRVNGKLLDIDFESVSGQPVFSLILDGKSYESFISQNEEDWDILLHGRQYRVKVVDEREKRLKAAGGAGASSGEFHLKAPMPGLIVSIVVADGQPVKKGQVLLILESMKMQNELKAPQDGIVGRIKVQAGDRVEQKQILLTVSQENA